MDTSKKSSSISALPRLDISPKFSASLFALLIFIHFMAMIAVFLSYIPLVVKLTLSCLVIISVLYYSRNNVFMISRGSVKRIIFHRAHWRLHIANTIQDAILLPGTYISAHIVIMRFSVESRYFPVNIILFRDASGEEQHRKLRRHLLVISAHQ